MAEVAKGAGIDVEKVKKRAHQLHESNPMLGHRGCRLGISYPEILKCRPAPFSRPSALKSPGKGKLVLPEIMIPLIATKKELDVLKGNG